MKTPLLFTLLLAAVQSSFGQGAIDWGNNFPAPNAFRAPIYDWDGISLTSISGQSSLGIPAGNTVYTAPLLAGTGFTFAVYVGPASVTDPEALTLLVSTTFRTSTAADPQGLPKGLVSGGTAVVPGVNPGEGIKFQIRAWDNQNGSVGWLFASTKGASQMVLSAPLGGTGTDGNIYPGPRTDGWTSFGLYYIPEPSTWALSGLAVLSMLGFARRRARSRFPKA